MGGTNGPWYKIFFNFGAQQSPLRAAQTTRTRAATGGRAATRDRTSLLCAVRTTQTRAEAAGGGATRDRSSLLRAGGRPLRAIKQVTFTLVWRAPRAGQANKSGGRAAGCDVQSKESLLPLPGCGRFTDGF